VLRRLRCRGAEVLWFRSAEVQVQRSCRGAPVVQKCFDAEVVQRCRGAGAKQAPQAPQAQQVVQHQVNRGANKVLRYKDAEVQWCRYGGAEVLNRCRGGAEVPQCCKGAEVKIENVEWRC